ncbi:hypothetical protein ACFV0R_29775 [Streptomyces sp. NPDC059578]|uniref:hypothetical protein n=1 Tax=Streptomyces sp. NPDC059578 TaxID=3346874 RepID=UPI0036CC6824
MPIIRGKPLAIFMTVPALALTIGTAYRMNFPPFEEQPRTISTGDTCEALGESKDLVPALRIALPKERQYTFINSPIQTSGYQYQVHCSARDEDRMTVIVLRTRLMQPMERENWISKQLNDSADDNPLVDFKAGLTATASTTRAGIQVPCDPKPGTLGGRNNLGVNVFLHEAGEASDKDTRQALIDIVRSAAEYAHKDAKCELPSKL